MEQGGNFGEPGKQIQDAGQRYCRTGNDYKCDSDIEPGRLRLRTDFFCQRIFVCEKGVEGFGICVCRGVMGNHIFVLFWKQVFFACRAERDVCR